MSEANDIQAVVNAILDGTDVDWNTSNVSIRTPANRDLLGRLRLISEAASPQRPAEADTRASFADKPGPLYRAVLVLAALKTTFGLIGWTYALVTGHETAPPLWPLFVNLIVFSVSALVLAIGGSRDIRARRLGAFFLLVASAFSDRLLAPLGTHDEARMVIGMARGIATDAFLALGLWLFVSCFPTVPARGSEQRISLKFLRVARALGVLLFAANAIPLLRTAGVSSVYLDAAAAAFNRHAPSNSLYWPLLFIMVGLALPYLLWKSRREAADGRRRIAVFVISFVAGVTPMILAVIIFPFVTVLHDSAVRDLVGLLLYTCLLLIVPMTAYAVLVDRAMDLQFIITAAMQHSAVRYVLALASVAPLGVFFVHVYRHRDWTVNEILANGWSIGLLPLPFLGLLVLLFRAPLLRVVDRRLLCEPPDSPEVLASLERSLRELQSVREVIETITGQVDRALHPNRIAVLLVEEGGRTLISPTHAASDLSLDSTLGTLIGFARDEIYAGVEAAGPVYRLLPREDRRWLAEHQWQLLVPLTGSGGRLLGVVALGEKRSGLPFSKVDRLLLASMATYGAMALENRSLRDASFRYLTVPSGPGWHSLDWDSEPAALCVRCSLVWPARTTTCNCNWPTTVAALPLMVSGKFRLERLIGSGGMSVVYLATDVALNRKVAIKTLPRLTAERVLRLQREARAMASVLHPNLALIFGIETWRGAPLLLVEYMDGGTLSDRLRAKGGGFAAREVVGLGIRLADVLERVHASGVLHRDIKPTNIGFTREDQPKLLDFGVAWMLQSSESEPPVDLRRPPRTAPAFDDAGVAIVSLTLADHIVGTPLYLSPEAVDGADADPSFDLWSLTLTLFEAIAGHNPLRGETVGEVFDRIRLAAIPDLRELSAECPDAVALFFRRALGRDLAQRPQSAGQLRNELRELLTAI